jgi:hypothetical protein
MPVTEKAASVIEDDNGKQSETEDKIDHLQSVIHTASESSETCKLRCESCSLLWNMYSMPAVK